jgi:hypothetical protein
MHPRFNHWRIRATLGVVVVGCLLFAVDGVASANQFGLRYWHAALTYGNISSITVPSASDQPANSGAMYLHRSVEQSDLTTSAGLIQAGWATLGSRIGLNNCGTTDSATLAFVETRPVNGAYTCHYYGQGQYPLDVNFNVFVNSSGWNAKIDGNLDPNGPYHIDAPDGYGMIGGESYLLSGVSGDSSTCYGEGPSAWDYYDSPNDGGSGSLLVSPNSSTDTIVTGGWGIEPAPTPLCDSYSS